MLSKVSQFISSRSLLSADGLHLVALSGGADSVALLLVLQQLGYRVEAVHCNFHLRGAESDRDEQFVCQLCRQRDVPLHLSHFDTKAYAALHHVSIEMAARQLRYHYFEQLRRDLGAQTVCVAHHRDDAVETLLLNLLRGTGIHGLTGIRSRRPSTSRLTSADASDGADEGYIVRPLLAVSRAEIERYLHTQGQSYVTDSTNLSDDVLRNKIRLHLVPLINELAPGASANIARTASYMEEAERVYTAAIDEQRRQLVGSAPQAERQSVSIESLLQLPSPESFLHEWLSPFGFNRTQTANLSARLQGHSGREYHSETHVLVVDRLQLILEPLRQPMKPMAIVEPGLYRIDESTTMRAEILTEAALSRQPFCATLDASDVEFPLTVRAAQPGDRFQPFGMKGQKLVSDLLTNLKMPLTDKRRQQVVADAGGRILWVVGLRTDHRFRITPATSSVLRLTVEQKLEKSSVMFGETGIFQ